MALSSGTLRRPSRLSSLLSWARTRRQHCPRSRSFPRPLPRRAPPRPRRCRPVSYTHLRAHETSAHL
eukprot:2201595-Alexandrium_andersonii.AAC.1